MYYSQSVRADVKKAKPEATFGEIGKEIGKMWHKLTDAEKAPFVKKAAEDKVRYDAVKGDAPKRKSTKKVKDASYVKRPLSSFMYYSQSVRADVKKATPAATFGEIGKQIGKQWKSLSEADKKPFAEMAVKDKVRYEAAKPKKQ
jgi:hypothetical protein